MLADAIMALSVVDGDGRMTFPSKESLAEACKVKLWQVWWFIEEAENIIVSEGMAVKRGTRYYLTEQYERYVRRLERTIAEMGQERSDETQSYDQSCMEVL